MLDPQIVIVLRAARFAIWRFYIKTAQDLFAKVQFLFEQIHGCRMNTSSEAITNSLRKMRRKFSRLQAEAFDLVEISGS